MSRVDVDAEAMFVHYGAMNQDGDYDLWTAMLYRTKHPDGPMDRQYPRRQYLARIGPTLMWVDTAVWNNPNLSPASIKDVFDWMVRNVVVGVPPE